MKKKDDPKSRNMLVQLAGTEIKPWLVPQNSAQALDEFLAEARCFFGIWDRQLLNDEIVDSMFADDEDSTDLLAILFLKWKEYLHHLNRERRT